MKIAHVSPTFFGDGSVVGGGERYALELARALSKHAETVLITFARTKELEVAKECELEVRTYPVGSFIKGNLANPLACRFLRDMADFNVLHCHGYPNAVTDLCILYAKLFHKKIFVTDIHGGGVCASTYLERLGFDTRRFIDGFLLTSAYNAQRYRDYANRVRIIAGGVDAYHFRPLELEREARVLFVGRLIPVKGINYLIEAVDEDTQVRIVGRAYDPVYYEELTSLARGKSIQFLTQAAEADLLREYASALVTVVPSVYIDMHNRTTTGELFGLVVLESMACGTPVIATRCGGLPEVIEDGITGFLVPPNDAAALGEKIRFLLDHPETARVMGEAGRKRVLRDFTWDRVAECCLVAYREALGAA